MTPRRRELHVSPQHADHDTEDGGHSRGLASVHQNGGDQGGVEADTDSEQGPAAVTWRGDVTLQMIRSTSSSVKL